MGSEGPRLSRERRTIRAMTEIYCSSVHGGGGLCEDCDELLGYAMARLGACPFGERKPTCANCAVHCYSGEYRQRVREVMRFSGPRMIYRHPLLAFSHILDSRKKPPRKREDPNGL